MTTGEKGGPIAGLPVDAVHERREAEVRGALARLGVEGCEFWRYPEVEVDEDLVGRVRSAIDSFAASLVLAPSPLERHPDDRAVAHAVRAAVRGGGNKLRVAFYELDCASPVNVLVDGSSVLEAKRAALGESRGEETIPDDPKAFLARLSFRK